MNRLRSYIDGHIDYFIIKDLVSKLCYLFFGNLLPNDTRLSYSQCYILLAVGVVNKTVDEIVALLNISADQILALLGKSIRKITNEILKIKDQEISKNLNLDNKDIKVLSQNTGLKSDNFYFKDILKTKKIQKQRRWV